MVRPTSVAALGCKAFRNIRLANAYRCSDPSVTPMATGTCSSSSPSAPSTRPPLSASKRNSPMPSAQGNCGLNLVTSVPPRRDRASLNQEHPIRHAKGRLTYVKSLPVIDSVPDLLARLPPKHPAANAGRLRSTAMKRQTRERSSWRNQGSDRVIGFRLVGSRAVGAPYRGRKASVNELGQRRVPVGDEGDLSRCGRLP